MAFVRKFKAVGDLKGKELFKEKLLNDIRDGHKSRFVFPAIRNERIDFYWGGGKLFSYSAKNGFTTHHKYASVLYEPKSDYISSKELPNCSLITSFEEGYERIKENCEKYSGVEASGASHLYEQFSYANRQNQYVVVLDIEAAFSNKDEENNRIDIVTYDLEKCKIRFVEAKHFSNKELRAKKPEDTPVIKQLEKYQKQISDSESKILDAYAEYIDIVNNLFEIELPTPKKVDISPILLIFGFDASQRGYLKNIKAYAKENNIRLYSIGDIKKSELSTVFRGGKQNW